MYALVFIILILVISFIPNLSKKNKVILSILVNNKISHFLFLALILFALLENYLLGLLLILLYFTINFSKLETVESFQNYYK